MFWMRDRAEVEVVDFLIQVKDCMVSVRVCVCVCVCRVCVCARHCLADVAWQPTL